MFRRLGGAAVVAAGICAGASAIAEPNAVPARPAVQSCSQAANVDLRLRRFERIDEIRVLVASHSPAHGAARVVVSAGEFDRTLYVHGGSHGLSFSTPLSGKRFRVTLGPIFSAPSSACVERIELRSRGRLVAAVTP